MMSPLVAAPIILTFTLLVSGLAKLPARTETVDAMTSLRLPLRGLHPLAAIAVPVVELVAAALLWVPIVPLQVVVSIGVALLMVAYLVIIARALTFEEQVECSCFGTIASPTVSRATLVRNILLTATALVGVIAAATGAIAAAVTTAPLQLLGWTLALAVACAITVFVLGGVRSAGAEQTDPVAAGPLDEGEQAEELDYLRQPIPYGMLETVDGSRVSLRELATGRAVLLLLLSYGCGPCERVLDTVPQWCEALGGLVHVQVVYVQKLDRLPQEAIDRAGGDPMHDLEGNISDVLELHGTPSAMLLGADRMTAGGPVTGGGRVLEFGQEILDQIQGAIDDGEIADPHAADRESTKQPDQQEQTRASAPS